MRAVVCQSSFAAPQAVRILQIVHQFPPHHLGGVELITESLARDLRLLNHSVQVLTRAPALADAPAHVTRIPEIGSDGRRFMATWRDAAATRLAVACMDQMQPDIAHAQHAMGHPLQLFDALNARRVPYVVSLHDYWFACANAQLVTNFDRTRCDGPNALKCGRCAAARAGLPGVAALALAPLMHDRNQRLRDVLGQAAAVTTPSRSVRDWFAAQGFDTGAWRVVPYGLNGAPIAPEMGNAAPRFVYIGGLAEQKGVHVLIEAFNRLPRQASLTVAGPLNAFPGYVAELRARATHPGIQFAGPLSRDDVWRALARSDALIAPSLWPEAFMLVAHEALAAGCALIASDIGALKDTAESGADVTLVPPGDVAALHAALRAIKPMVRHVRPFRRAIDYAADMAALYAEVAPH